MELVALLQFVVMGIMVGRARGLYGVKAPATTGHEQFERWFRVHYNTLEKLIVFLPSLWLFGYYVGQYYAAGLGGIYLVGRLLYAVTYIRDPATRGLGTLLSDLPMVIMLLGGLIAIILEGIHR